MRDSLKFLLILNETSFYTYSQDNGRGLTKVIIARTFLSGCPLGNVLLEVFSIHPTVLLFQGVGTERLGKRQKALIFREICQEFV